jgi:hypothetical protein
MNDPRIWHHTLTPGLVSCLVKAIQFVHAHNRNEFHLQRDLDLSHSEYANFQKLRYFALVHPIEGKRGFYLITKWRGMFLRGEIDMPTSVSTQDNHRVGKSEQRIHIRELRGKIPEFQSEFADETPSAKVEHQQPALSPSWLDSSVIS